MCEALLIRKVDLVHATQDLTIGVYKQICKILLPVALCDSILVPDLRTSLVKGGSNVVVSVILRLTAGVWPLSYRDLNAFTNGFRFRILQPRRLDKKHTDSQQSRCTGLHGARAQQKGASIRRPRCIDHAHPAGHQIHGKADDHNRTSSNDEPQPDALRHCICRAGKPIGSPPS